MEHYKNLGLGHYKSLGLEHYKNLRQEHHKIVARGLRLGGFHMNLEQGHYKNLGLELHKRLGLHMILLREQLGLGLHKPLLRERLEIRRSLRQERLENHMHLQLGLRCWRN